MDGKVTWLFSCSSRIILSPFSLSAVFGDFALVTLKVQWAKCGAVMDGIGATNNRLGCFFFQ